MVVLSALSHGLSVGAFCSWGNGCTLFVPFEHAPDGDVFWISILYDVVKETS